MPKRDLLLDDLKGESDYGVLLVAQMGGVPNELQFVIETAAYDEAVEGLRPKRNYIVRALGVREHRVSVGLFGRLSFADDHPILIHHNTPRVAVHFTGKPADVNELMVDITQAYISTFGPWRHVVEMAEDLNRATPLLKLFETGFGLLGTMPKPLADRMAKVLTHHKLNVNMAEDTSFELTDEHGRSRLLKALLIDMSYVVALDFSVEELGKV
jgi:hypothetical protein